MESKHAQSPPRSSKKSVKRKIDFSISDSEEEPVSQKHMDVSSVEEPFSKLTVFREQCDLWINEMAQEVFEDISISYVRRHQNNSKTPTLVIPMNTQNTSISDQVHSAAEYKHNPKSFSRPVTITGSDSRIINKR